MKRHKSPEKSTPNSGNGAQDSPIQMRQGSPAWAAQAQATHGNAYVQMMVQKQLQAKGQAEGENVQEVAAEGISGAGSELTFQDEIQASFGHHDISDVRAHTDSRAHQAASAIGADAYARGSDIALGNSQDLHTQAHEAAHVVQQKAGVSLKGGVGQAGDSYEQHADKVADKVVQGKSAEGLLDQSCVWGPSASLFCLGMASDGRGCLAVCWARFGRNSTVRTPTAEVLPPYFQRGSGGPSVRITGKR